MTSPLHPSTSAPPLKGHPSSSAPLLLRSSAPLLPSSSAPPHILVTGGAGFIGSHLVDALVTQGHRVRVFDNLEPQVHGSLREQENWPDYANPGAEYVLGDLRDRDALRKAMQGVDVVFHEAAAVGVGQSMYEIERYVDANTRGTAVLLDILANDASIRSHVRKLIVASSMSIYGEGKYECPVHGVVYPKLRPNDQLAARDWEMRCAICDRRLAPLPTDEEKPLYPTSIYAITKKDQEEMCLAVGQAYGMPTVALRYFNVYGSRQALSNPYTGVAAIFSSRLLNGKPPVIFEDGQQSRDFVHVSDIVQANLLAMVQDEADYGVFNVGTGRSLTILDVADALSDHFRQISGYQPSAISYQPSAISYQPSARDCEQVSRRRHPPLLRRHQPHPGPGLPAEGAL